MIERPAPDATPTKAEFWLLPGMDGTGHLFDRLTKVFAPSRQVRVFSYDDRTSNYDALLEALPRPERTIVVVGESFGGPLAIRLARREADRVARLVLIASFVRAPRPLLGAASALVARMPTPPSPALRLAMVGRDADDALVDDVARAIRETPRETIAARLRTLAALDVSEDARALACPVTAIVATHDRLVPRRAAEEAARLAARGRIETIEGPHLLAQRCPLAVAAVIEADAPDDRACGYFVPKRRSPASPRPGRM